MGGISGTFRRPKPGLSALGSFTRVFVYTTDQFTDDTDYPLRSQIIAGKVSTALPLKTSPAEKAARIIFDIAEAGGSFSNKSSSTQSSFVHSLAGKVAGYTTEQAATADELFNKLCIIVAERSNGDKIVFGTLFKPLMIEISGDLGKKGDDYVGHDVKFTQTDACDFKPPILDSTVTIASNTIPAYS